MNIESMTDQQIIDYLRTRKKSSKVVGVAKANTVDEFLERYGITPRCPHCGSEDKVKSGTTSNGITRFKCSGCGRRYSLTANTLFEGLPYSVDEMINAIHAVITQQSTVFMAENVCSQPINKSVAWLLTRKIQSVLASMPTPKLSGVIEIDEKYIREAQKGSKSLVSFLDRSSNRRARRHNYRSECGIFGPEFVNVLCATDHSGHYWAECVCLGPMGLEELSRLRSHINNVAYVCTDNYDLYSEWCEQEGFKHYVEPSTYRKECQARGYINTDNIYHALTSEEYAKDEAINRAMYRDGRYPHIENSNHKISYDEFIAIRSKFGLGINRVNSFHSMLQKYIITHATNVSSQYLQDYVKSFTWLMNYKADHNIRSFTKWDAANILAEMCRYSIENGVSTTLADIRNKTVTEFNRPSKRAITLAKRQMKSARKVIKLSVDMMDMSAYEGDDDSVQYLFNKEKFFRDIGTIRLNELAKLYGVYDRKENKATRIKRLSALPNVQEIIFLDVFISQYGSVDDLKEALDRRPQKRKRGRPRKEKSRSA